MYESPSLYFAVVHFQLIESLNQRSRKLKSQWPVIFQLLDWENIEEFCTKTSYSVSLPNLCSYWSRRPVTYIVIRNRVFLWCIIYCFVLTSQTPTPPSRKEIYRCGRNADADLHLKAIHASKAPLLASLDERPQAFLFRINWKTMFKGLFLKLKTLSYGICWRRVTLRGKRQYS